MNVQKTFNSIFHLIRETFTVLKENDPLRMAGATAFFSAFALPPIVMIIVRSLGLFFDRRLIGTKLLGKLGNVIGPQGREQVFATITSVLALQENWWLTGGIFIFLLFVATTLFKVIKSSINQIWKIRMNKQRGIWPIFRSRFYGAALILFTGILFLTSMLADILQTILGNYIIQLAPDIGQYMNSFLNKIVSIVIDTIWFFMLFYYLPDGRPKLRITIAGALVTGMLFEAGKFLLRAILISSNIGNLYGTSGALVLVLLFVFYSSLILYFGVSFIKALSQHSQQPIRPRAHAMRYELSEITLEKSDEG